LHGLFLCPDDKHPRRQFIEIYKNGHLLFLPFSFFSSSFFLLSQAHGRPFHIGQETVSVDGTDAGEQPLDRLRLVHPARRRAHLDQGGQGVGMGGHQPDALANACGPAGDPIYVECLLQLSLRPAEVCEPVDEFFAFGVCIVRGFDGVDFVLAGSVVDDTEEEGFVPSGCVSG
jgi:hypothetical protein